MSTRKVAQDELTEEQLKQMLQRPKYRLVNPVTATRRALARRKVTEEKRLLRREELMKQDAERYLMELEERHCWLAYELKARNLSRMIKEENARYLIRKEEKNEKNRLLQLEKEEGLSYFRGQITEYRRWQNSAAKHLDITGHEGPVSAVKLSPCLKYIASCSWDNTAKIWSLKSGKCLITLSGHKKKVNDIGIHPNFAIDSEYICLVTCSSDCTINLWSCVNPKPVKNLFKVITGHTEAVYKCSFSPDGRRVVSCSEDQTARIWCIPEGYLLFVFKAHSSPVSTAKFSPSGRYLVTGSDYGERRLMLWDASFPHFHSPVQFPHYIYWTPDGLIKKILIRKDIPSKHFWMTQKQLGLLDENEMVETWPGENATLDDIDSESDDSNNEDDGEGLDMNDDDFGKDDMREDAGATVLVTAVDKNGIQSAATEYIPGGGTLIVTLQSYINPIAEAFVSVNLKDDAFDSFGEKSGARVGTFQASAPIPWRPFITDPLNIRAPYRHPPKTVKETCHGKAFQYKEIRQFNRFTGEEILSSTAVEMLWNCPPPNLGPVVVTVNLRLRNEKFWRKLTYSLKESPIRMNVADDDGVNGEDGERYLFNQEERHDVFWSYVREQNWEAVESFFEKKCALFYEHRMFIRKRRILQFLKRLFSTVPISLLPTVKRPYNRNKVEFKHMILVWPFIHLPGHTRSSILVEDVEVFPDNKSNQSFQSYHEASVKDDESTVDGSLVSEKSSPAKNDRQKLSALQEVGISNPKLPLKDSSMPLSLPERNAPKLTPAPSEVLENSATNTQIPEIENTKIPELEEHKADSSEESEAEHNSSDEDSDDDGDDDDEDSDDSSDDSSDEDSSDEESKDSGHETQPNASLEETKNDVIPPPQISTTIPARQSPKASKPVQPKAKESNIWNRFLGNFLYKNKVPKSNLSSLAKEKKKKLNIFEGFFQTRKSKTTVSFQNDIFDDSDDEADAMQLKSKKKSLRLPKVIYTEPIEGKEFQSKVNQLATEEANLVSRLEFLGVPVAEECRVYTSKGYSVEDMKEIGQFPLWLQQHDKISPVGITPESVLLEEGEQKEDNLLRDGRYGPRYEGLDMTLPVNYPVTAGLAKEALENNLKKDRKAKELIEKNRIPTTTEVLAQKDAAEKRVWIPTPKWLKEKQKRREKRRQIEVEVGMNLMLSNSYAASRRESLVILPGMKSHYPNPSYEMPAKLPQNFTPKQEQQRLLSRFFTKKKNSLNIQISDPVGRKPLELSSQYQEYLDSLQEEELKRLRQKEEEERLLLAQFGGKEGVENSTEIPNVQTPAVSQSIVESAEVSAINLVTDNQSISTLNTGSVVQANPPISIDNINSNSLEVASFGQQKKGSLFSKSSSDIYLDRRGSYLIAPGLESFSKYLEEKKNPLKMIKFDQFGRPISSLRKSSQQGQSIEEEVMTPRKEIKAAGLIRVMNTNGFDIAHQGTIFDAIFSPSENRIVSCGGDSLIKIWDPRDGTFVRRLSGHTSEVTAISYSANELYLVSGGGDQTILIWDMTTFEVTRTLRGHTDVINGLTASHDFTFIVSCSYDNLIKTWFLTPRNPDAPLAPKIITTTQTSVMISWQAPPSFNEPITAFEVQYQIPGQDDWGPNPAISVPPHYRQKTIINLSPATTYQFRLRATNRMGVSEWGAMSKYVTTKLGVPLKLPRPDICELTCTSISLFFFVPNPKIFGASPKTLIFNKSGEGKDFDDEKYVFTLEECLAKGAKLVESFRYWSTAEGQRKRKKLNRSKNKDAQGLGLDIPLVLMTKTLEQCASVDTLLVSVTIENLHPGLLYRFRVCGVNAEGQGEWSDSSYSQSTLPSVPERPVPPIIEKKDLTWIIFKWSPPPDNGSAIVGYRVFVKHLNYQFDLPRWQNTYRITHLVPGESYYLKVLAKNAVGWSDYSEYNSLENSTTATAPPDVPANPQAVGAEWGTMTLTSVIPYDNGMPIHQFHIQHRVVQAFSKGIWSGDITYSLQSADVEYLDDEEVEENPFEEEEDRDSEEEHEEERKSSTKLISKRSSSKNLSGKNNMLPSRKRIVRMATGNLELTKETLSTHIDKPKGKKIKFTVVNLQSNTLYEFRVSYENLTGRSDYSIPSQRAKTRKAQVPDRMRPPRYIDVMPSYVNLSFIHPPNGGDDILFFIIKLENVDQNTTQLFRVLPHATEHRIESLLPGGKYKVCIVAQNNIGEGDYSNWTQIVTLPKDIHELMNPKSK